MRIQAVSSDGPKYLKDLRAIEEEYAIGDVYSYSSRMQFFEQYVVFVRETILSIGLSLCAVFLVVLFVTGSV